MYDAYKRRWMIEQMFHIYKQIEELDETRVQADASVLGSYFISFLSTIMTAVSSTAWILRTFWRR